MNEVWISVNRIRSEILAFSSEEKLMQWAQEMHPKKKSLRLMPYVLGEMYVLLNHNAYIFPYSHRIYRIDLDTGEETSFSQYY